jgi:O-acetylhomoserine (thiol)-lyase
MTMAEAKFHQLDTLAVHAGQRPDPVTGARAVPIYQTTSFVFQDVDHAAALFNLERPGHLYSRISNPTVAVLEERIAALDKGVAALATASGHAALVLSIVTLMGQGAHIVASSRLYGGSINLFTHTLPRFGITATLVDPRDPGAFAAAIRPETRLLVAEAIGNPGLEVLDLPAVAEVAHSHRLPLLIDNTFLTPYLLRPIEQGADLVLHSATKWLGGHGLALGGVVVDGGVFDWEASGLFPTLTEPYDGYHGIDYAEEYGPAAFAVRARTEGLRDFGAIMAPQNAFYILQGVETLSLRMARHMENTYKVLEFLKGREEVAWVLHPDLPEHPDHALAKRLLPKGSGSIVSFGIKGGREAGRRFIEGCRLASHLANVGDAKTLIIHPASTTHSQMEAEDLARAGVGEDMVRLSIGIEDADDIIADFKQALRASQRS